MTDDTTLRPLTGADAPAHRRLMAQAFDRGRVQKDTDRTEEEEASAVNRCIGIFDASGELQAAQQTHSFTIQWPGSIGNELLMGGVAGVATRPEARGRKYVDRLLRDTLVRMKEEGQVVSALYPFAWAFYRRFGWDWVGEKRTVTIPLRELSSAPEGKHVRQIPSEGADKVLEPIYTEYAAKYRGMFKTESHRWKSSLGDSDDRTTYIYAYFPEGGDKPTAYLLWRYGSGDSGGGVVREFVANTPDGFRALLSLLHYLGTQCQTARITLPADTPLWSFIMHWDVKTEIQPVFMGRVVDVCAALSQLSTPVDLPTGSVIRLGVRDEAAPWNNGTFQVEIKDGAVQCTPLSEAGTVDVALDIQALTQAYWGTPSLNMLRNAGRIEVNNEAAFAALEKLMPATPVFTFDFF